MITLSTNFFRFLAVISLIFTLGVWAESGLVSAQSDNQPSAEEIFNLLVSEKIVIAGLGFRNGQIGDPISYIRKIWGPPAQEKENRLTGSVELSYQSDPHTIVRFQGGKTVRSILISGNSASLIRTQRGLRFGMQEINILRMYSRYSAKKKKRSIRYKSAGIEFFLTDGRLSLIEVF